MQAFLSMPIRVRQVTRIAQVKPPSSKHEGPPRQPVGRLKAGAHGTPFPPCCPRDPRAAFSRPTRDRLGISG
jgi:hypothetical protein